MQISLRSQLVAGVAALGVTAVAATPLAPPDLTPSAQRVSAAVELTAFASPVNVLLDTVYLSLADVFWQAQIPLEDLFWPDSFYNEDFSSLYSPVFWGLGPDTVNQFSNGTVSAVLSNISGYIDSTIYGTTALVGGVADAVFNIPFALIAAAQLALAGNIPGAIAELQTQILGPLQDGVTGAIQGIGWVVDNIIANSQTLLTSTVPRVINDAINFVLGSGSYLVQNVIGTASAIVTNLASLNLEGAWNAAVEGLLGYEGIVGSIEQLTVGIGIVEDVDYDGDVVPTVVYPSVRSLLTSNAQRLGNFGSLGEGGIRNGSFVPETAAAVQTAPAAAVAQGAAVAEVAGAAEAAEVDGQRPVAAEVDGQRPVAAEADVQRPPAGAGPAGSGAGSAAGSDGASEDEGAGDGGATGAGDRDAAPAAGTPAKGAAARNGGRGPGDS